MLASLIVPLYIFGAVLWALVVGLVIYGLLNWTYEAREPHRTTLSRK